jgi:hypothetical protein
MIKFTFLLPLPSVHHVQVSSISPSSQISLTTSLFKVKYLKQANGRRHASIVACLNYIFHRIFTAEIPKYLKFSKYFEVYFTKLIIECRTFVIQNLELIFGFLCLFYTWPSLIPNKIPCDAVGHTCVILLKYHKVWQIKNNSYLTYWGEIFWESNGLSARKFLVVYGTRKLIIEITKTFHLSLPGTKITQFMPSIHFLYIHINIILLSRPRPTKWRLSFRFSDWNPAGNFPFSRSCHMLYPTKSASFDHPNNTL